MCDYIPLTRPRRNYNHPLPRCVRASVLKKRRLWRKWRTNPTAENKREFNTASRRCSKAVHEYHVQQEESLLRNGAQKFYRYISNQLHPRSGDILLQGPNGQLKSASDIADCFAEKFAKNFSSTTGPTTTQGQNLTVPNNATHCQQNCNISPLEHVSITYTTVYKALSNQKCSAASPDGLPGVFYKTLSGALVLPMTIVFQQSLYQCCIPDAWRLAHVTPLYKGKGDKITPSAYRPISLIDVACKLLERLIASEIRLYWTQHGLLFKEQHGFVPHRSTVSNLLQCDALIANYLNDSVPYDVFLLDFSRAFDKVEHHTLIDKLGGLNIAGGLLCWLENFLQNRVQCVVYNGSVSLPKPVKSGVIQGSVIGPTMFLGFINDLPTEVSTCDLELFADDSKFIVLARDEIDRCNVQRDLSAIGRWSV